MSNHRPTETDLSAEAPTASADNGYARTKPKVGVDEKALAILTPNAIYDREAEESSWRHLAKPVDWVTMGLTSVAWIGSVGAVVCAFAGADAAAYTVLGGISTPAVGAVARYLWRR